MQSAVGHVYNVSAGFPSRHEKTVISPRGYLFVPGLQTPSVPKFTQFSVTVEPESGVPEQSAFKAYSSMVTAVVGPPVVPPAAGGRPARAVKA